MFIGGIIGIVFTGDLDETRQSSVASYVGLVAGGVLGAAAAAFGHIHRHRILYLYRGRILGLMQAEEEWRR